GASHGALLRGNLQCQGQQDAVPARCAEAVHPTPCPLADAQALEVAALVAYRRHLVTMLTAERQRLGPALPAVRSPTARPVGWLQRELDDRDHTLRGWGPVPSGASRSTCCAGSLASSRPPPCWRGALPEVGRLPCQAIAALVGGALLSGDSGTGRGRRVVW